MTEEQALEIINLLTTQNEILTHQYAGSLYVIGCGAAIFVCVLLYKFLKACF